MRDRARRRRARALPARSFRNPTRSSAISTASRSLEAPSDSRASSSSRGSSQKALRTFPIRVARGAEPVLALLESVDRRVMRVDVGTTSPQSVRNRIPRRAYGWQCARGRAIRWCPETPRASQRQAFAERILQERSLAPDRIIRDAATNHSWGDLEAKLEVDAEETQFQQVETENLASLANRSNARFLIEVLTTPVI